MNKKLFEELYRISSLNRLLNEQDNTQSIQELRTFVYQYIDNNGCKTMHDNLDSFWEDIQSGKITFLNDSEKGDIKQMVDAANGENALNAKLRDQSEEDGSDKFTVFINRCNEARKVMKSEFDKMISDKFDSALKSLCWFNMNKYKTDQIMNACSSFITSQDQKTTNHDQPTEETPTVDQKTEETPTVDQTQQTDDSSTVKQPKPQIPTTTHKWSNWKSTERRYAP